MHMMWDVDEEMELRLAVAEARYLIHFKKYFPFRLVFGEHVTDEVVVKVEKIVDDCITQNEPYPVPDDYDERLY